VFSVTLGLASRRAVFTGGGRYEPAGAVNRCGDLFEDNVALIKRDSWRIRNISAVRIVNIPITIKAIIGSLPNEVLSDNFAAPTIMAINPNMVISARAVPITEIAIFRFIEGASVRGAVGVLRFAPQRLQYFSSI
jgi:hypothetical protein